ncbi:MAG: nucleoside-diphosphate kinase [Candidatus Harrisonbacteria bacterium]|nr:nucleoside-diphosphate kinase [Candidatus Harrisonbacteria bacterium]
MKKEKTLVIIKPDGIQRTLIGEIIKRFERSGLKLVALKMALATPEMVEKHYTVNSEWKKNVGEKTIKAYEKKGATPPSMDPIVLADKVLSHLKKYMTSGPVVAMVWQGMHAVGVVRKITGATEPLSSDVGTIRGDYTIDSYQVSDTDGRSVRNLIHASGDPVEAAAEIALWFTDNELHNYRLFAETVLYDANFGV